MTSALIDDVLSAIGTRTVASGPVRIGIDLVSVSDFEKLLSGPGGRDFVTRSFTDSERSFCAGRTERLAVRWAAKEAVAKAIGTGFRGLRPLDVEVVHHPDGRPTIAKGADNSWPSDAESWQWSVSLSHEGEAAIAIAVGLIYEGGKA